MARRVSRLPSDQEFTAYMEPHLNRLEADRRRLRSRMMRRRWIAGAFFLSAMGFLIYARFTFFADWNIPVTERRELPPWYAMAVPALVMMSFFFWVELPRWTYHKWYKTRIFELIAKFFGDFDYVPRARISTEQLRQFGVLPGDKYCIARDLISGRYKGAKVTIWRARIDNNELSLQAWTRPIERRSVWSITKEQSLRDYRLGTIFCGVMVLLEQTVIGTKLERAPLRDFVKDLEARGARIAILDHSVLIMLKQENPTADYLTSENGGPGTTSAGLESNPFSSELGSIHDAVWAYGTVDRIGKEYRQIMAMVDRFIAGR